MFTDIRYALRILRQNPGFASVAILSLALGIGANTSIYSFAEALLFRPIPVPHASGIVDVDWYLRGDNFGGSALPTALSYPDFADFRSRTKSFQSVAGYRYATFGFATRSGATPEVKFGLFVSGSFFRTMEITPEKGRDFRLEEDQSPGRDAVVIISHSVWENEFASAPDVIGKNLFLDGIAFTVIGVAPKRFTGVDQFTRPAVYVPMMMETRIAASPEDSFLNRRNDRGVQVKGRLKPGISVAAAAAEARIIADQLARAYPATDHNWTADVATELEHRIKQSPPNALLIGFLLALAVVVLLIACANVTNLMLSRARARSREIAVRLAIGAGRRRLLRQLLTESLVIAVLGGGLGLVLAQSGVEAFSNISIPAEIPLAIDVTLDPRVVVFALCATIGSAILFGLAPAIQATQTDLVPALRSGTEDGARRTRLLGRNALVIAQITGSLILLVFASQLYRGSAILLTSRSPFRTRHVLLASFNPALVRYSPAQTQQFYTQLLDKTRALAGVKSAALAQALPLSPLLAPMRIVPEGYQLPRGSETVTTLSNVVTDGYFESMNIPIVEGRGFARTDSAGALHVAVVNEQFARKYYPRGSAVGKSVRINGRNGDLLRIVGVARQSKYLFLAEPPIEVVYVPLAQREQEQMTLAVETTPPPATLAGPLRALVRSIDTNQPVFALRTMDEYFEQRSTKAIKILTNAFGALGILGVVLAVAGLYGLISYSVTRRTREIGIRMAIGAGHREVQAMVLRQGMLLAAIGVAIGLVFSSLLARFLTANLRTPPFNTGLLVIVPVVLFAVAAAGSYIPARRASLIDPNIVLHQD